MKARLAAIVAAIGMIATPALAAPAPALAAPAPAMSLSVAKSARASASTTKGEKLRGAGTGRFLIGAAVTAAIVAGIFIAAHEIGSDSPDSN